ncbi:uncharacterized protein CMU_017230 [Cryptosporidium muris RN66]|uniref:Uncharacterized protein n=1 Tax=Cryptosporidium muris (strain RN66) TaxID=441375 RepID=B6ACW7_CRYMR|nr:uncharacterized protein CMU_017230 [Cryptosporidium muris RN66]EEA05971.1 hypothetical protein, conserved [Cryptosporidium muris RN66]|eukprot:XP_002140320.1 hypothetical protein [Cryptosporidium muris RN66]
MYLNQCILEIATESVHKSSFMNIEGQQYCSNRYSAILSGSCNLGNEQDLILKPTGMAYSFSPWQMDRKVLQRTYEDISLIDYSLNMSGISRPISMGITCRETQTPNTISSSSQNRRALKDYLESFLISGSTNVTVPSPYLNISRTLSIWQKTQGLQSRFVADLIDFAKLCGVPRHHTYKDLFHMLIGLFKTKLKSKEMDCRSYPQFESLVLNSIRDIQTPQLVEPIISMLLQFPILPPKIINEILSLDTCLSPTFATFYKLAPLKLKQQIWLERPRWFIAEITPFIMKCINLLSNVDSFSKNTSSNFGSSQCQNINAEINKLFEFVTLKRNINRESSKLGETNDEFTEFYREIEESIFNNSKHSSKDSDILEDQILGSICSSTSNTVEQSNFCESLSMFALRSQALYIASVETEYDDLEKMRDLIKIFPFSTPNTKKGLTSFIKLEKEQYGTSQNISCLVLNSSLNQNSTSLSLSSNFVLCGNILEIGRIIAYIAYCIGDYADLYICFASIIRQIFSESLSCNINMLQTFPSILNSSTPIKRPVTSNSSNFDVYIPNLPPSVTTNSILNSLANPVYLANNMNVPQLDHNSTSNNVTHTQNTRLTSNQLKGGLGEPYLVTVRVLVALRLFNKNNKCNRNQESNHSSIMYSSSIASNTSASYGVGNIGTSNISANSGNNIGFRTNNEETCNNLNFLVLSECDPIIWPCISIVGSTLRDGFACNRTQESLMNVSYTLIIKSEADLSDVAFAFSEPHFLMACSEFIVETAIATMSQPSVDALLVLDPQRRKIPLALLVLGMNSPYTFINSNNNINKRLYGNYGNIDGYPTVSGLNQAKVSRLAAYQINNTSSVVPSLNMRKRLKISDIGHGTSSAMRLDSVFNYLVTTNTTILPREAASVNLSTQNQCPSKNLIIHKAARLSQTVLSTFLPLLDRYLEVSLISANSSSSSDMSNKTKRNETLKIIRNELKSVVRNMEISSANYETLNMGVSTAHESSTNCRELTMIVSLQVVRLISLALFFVGLKPHSPIKNKYNTTNTLNISSNCNNELNNTQGFIYGHVHLENSEMSSYSTCCTTSMTPTCIDLSIRLMEISLASDWITHFFLKSIVCLLCTYPRILPNLTNISNSRSTNNDLFSIQDSNYTTKSLIGYIPSDIVQALICRIVIPSIRDPLIGSSELNLAFEIITNNEVCKILDSKTKRACIERIWNRNPFAFNIHTNEVDGNDFEVIIQDIHLKDLVEKIKSVDITRLIVSVYIPYKLKFWKYHFIGLSDTLYLWKRWLVYLGLCISKLDPSFSEIHLLYDTINKN